MTKKYILNESTLNWYDQVKKMEKFEKWIDDGKPALTHLAIA